MKRIVVVLAMVALAAPVSAGAYPTRMPPPGDVVCLGIGVCPRQ